MRRIIYTIIIAISFLTTSCTKNNYIDTGICNGRYDGNFMEYMEAHPYDWSLTLELIRFAGEDMVRLFEGNDPDHPEITFFGLTNHSIRRYLLQNDIKQVTDLDADWCRSLLLRHIVDGKYFRNDFPAGKPSDYGTVGTGGITLTTLAGTQIWAFVVVQEKQGIVENASKPVSINFLNGRGVFGIGSADIEPNNGVVHAIGYAFTLGDEE